MVVGDVRLGARRFVAPAVEVSPCVLLIFTLFALFACTDGHLVVPFGEFRCAGAKLGVGLVVGDDGGCARRFLGLSSRFCVGLCPRTLFFLFSAILMGAGRVTWMAFRD